MSCTREKEIKVSELKRKQTCVPWKLVYYIMSFVVFDAFLYCGVIFI